MHPISAVFSKPGELVVEPFVGGGTTVQACIDTGRSCFAYEIDNHTFETIRRRLHVYLRGRCSRFQ
ncbi:MAG: hypothetical protein JRN20_13305 [Nitrososphaerota archaeon]|nr:hypothetical protein [Nitrososphaerota archaeon]